MIVQAFFVYALPVPPLNSRVTDLAGVLNDQTKWNLEERLKNYELKSSNQVAVLIIQSLQGENLEEYTHRVASVWQLGQQGSDNGVLLLIAIQDRKMRIEVGYGLESTLTDVISSHIIHKDIAPYFKKQQYGQGVENGVSSIVAVLKKTYDTSKIKKYSLENYIAIVMAIVGVSIGLMVFMLNIVFSKQSFSAYAIVFVFSTMLGMAYHVMVIELWILVLGLSVLAFFVMLRLILHHSRFASVIRKRLYSKRKTKKFWYSGFGTRMNSSSGRSGSRGFSGGGGSFGGGGASGSW